ncbi:monomeric [FeFe] hydrogenase [Carboxylicivirga linearis]|uniref:Monomeric [FeFe] hydrogenase n=1 Tax=Carboxylicivirga linearis TaxID=1628157 RepID=A0ABS5JR02_9BACT|nr:monomeric [FeFe] hydrogenase [Carboxylicivirga linearis]MBS2097294.1 monomeric [FeFe] hydrogenase [Carboxylicivirga linearis]
MTYFNNAVRTKRELLIRLIQLLDSNQLFEHIDRIPLDMRPKTKAPIRCCVHKDRAVIKYKLMAAMGFNISDEEDELTPLRDYALKAIEGIDSNGEFLTVVDEACSSCVQVNYTVSNLCQGCEGRPCQVNCPKDAITVINGKANIDHHKCVNCGLCQKACPFHAIAYLPVPCEESCPVKAIRKDEYGIEKIDFDKCIHCGKCMTSCPFGAIAEKSQILHFYNTLKLKKQKMVALVAPAVLSQYKASSSQILEAIKSIGFDKVVEVAEGAEVTTQEETKELMENINQQKPFMTTSCCPAYVSLAEKHLPKLKEHISHTPTPMYFTAKQAKETYPDHATVFIGPCLAKRQEAYISGLVDFVITTEELGSIWTALQIDPTSFTDSEIVNQQLKPQNRGFAASGGVHQSILLNLNKDAQIRTHIINGLNKKSIKLLKAYTKKEPNFDFIEVMACEGGCISGPGNIATHGFSQNNLQKVMDELAPEPAMK